ncbi:hypothetical protein [Legionella sp. CNM-4043-24]|uniref:hypothetical protein n=1 Tax=Legionella sp. CNM-4043-24 TaxID=3421646 RepID=UPI00403ACB56
MRKKSELVRVSGASSVEHHQAPLPAIDYRYAVDTYVYKGQQTDAMVLNPEKRKAFFDANPQMRALLLREKHNPLLEEGEHYLTYEALTLLIQRKLRWQRSSASGLAYNYRNIYVIKNNPDLLHDMLSMLSLRNKDDAKCIYIDGIHAVAFYLRNEEGVIKCFVVDSEITRDESSSDIVSSVRSVFPEAMIYLNNTLLQEDYYSCATFAFKCLLYFVKHGGEVFPWLEQHTGNAPELSKQTLRLPSGVLMPALLKMTQSRLDLSDEILDAYVCHKKQITLRDYFAMYAVSFHGKACNSSALEKKYKYLRLINKLILDTSPEEAVNPSPDYPLPARLLRQHARYARLPRQSTLFTQANSNIITRYLNLVDFFDRQPGSFDPAGHRICLSDARRINNKFPQFLPDYQNKFHGVTRSDSVKLEKLLYIAGAMETNTVEHVDLYVQDEIKLRTLFGTYKKALAYLQKYAQQQQSRQPVHDACLFRLPPVGSGVWDRAYWASLVMNYGPKAFRYLALAPRIEALRRTLTSQSGAAASSTDSGSNELEQCRYLIQHYRYPRADDNPELAKLCHRHLIAEEIFNQTLEIVRHIKSFDFLPDITIQGEEIDRRLSPFVFKKLPVGDYQGLFLGMDTACCQSIGMAGAACAVHGMRSLMSGFYVIYDKSGQIVAQLWAWIGTQGELVFDSFERSQTKMNFLCEPFVNRAAERLLQQGFERVLIGRGNTPQTRWADSPKQAKQCDPCRYTDAACQKLVKEASQPRSLLEKYQAFARHTDVSLPQYLDIFAAETDGKCFETRLADLILTGQMDYTVFLQMTSFCYRTSQAFLHRQSPQNETLLAVLLNQFGEQMEPFLTMKGEDGNTVLDWIIRNGNPDLRLLCLETLSRNPASTLFGAGDEKITRMAHVAARHNDSRTLTWIHSQYYPNLSWGAFIALPDEEGLSVLACAAKSQHSELVRAIVLRITEPEILHRLVKQPYEEKPMIGSDLLGSSIIHFLAKHNDMDSLEYIRSTIRGSALNELFNQNAGVFQYGFLWSATPALVAIMSHAWSFARYLLQNFYSKDAISSFIFQPSLGSSRNLLNHAFQEDDRDLVAFLHSFYPDEVQWLQILLKKGGLHDDNAIFFAMKQSKSLSAAMYLIDTMVSFENLHQLLSFKSSKHLLALYEHPAREESMLLLRKVMARYEPHRDKWNALTDPYIIRTVISFGDLDFFAEYLAFIRRDQALFDLLLADTDYVNLMDSVLRMHQNVRAPVSQQTELAFLDCLLTHYTEPQIQHLLHHCSYRQISLAAFNRLMAVAAKIDQGRYWNEWISLENRQLQDEIFINRRDSFVLTDRLLACYKTCHGQASVQAMLQSQLDDLLTVLIHNDNVKLLQQVYPLICSSQQRIKTLLLQLLKCTNSHHGVYSVTLWLIEQETVSLDLLKEFIAVEERRALFQGQSNADYCEIFVAAALWNGCVKKGASPESLSDIIDQIFHSVIFRLMSAINKTLGSHIETMRELNGIKLLIDEWLTFQYPDNRQCFDIISSQGVEKRTLFYSVCAGRHWDLINLMLLRCTHDQRELLVERYKNETSEKDPAIVPTLIALCQHYRHLDHLLALRADMADESTDFLQASPDEQNRLRTLLDELDPARLFYCDSQGNLHIIDTDTIDRIWQEVQRVLPDLREERIEYRLTC